MPIDTFAAKGSTSASKPDAGKANLRTVPVFGIVKDNIDPIKAGRIQVYIDDLGGSDPDSSDSWMTVNYLPPFYGYTDASGGDTNYGDFIANPASYGMWFSPPDIGTKVICIFVNGDPNYGFYLGGVPKPEALRMIPAIGANFDKEKVIFNQGEAESYGGATRLPVTNMNTNNDSEVNDPSFLLSPKPVHSYTASIMNQQGIIRDSIRGPIGTSSQRESPSRVGWGVSTPGRPIYEGGFSDETIVSAAQNSSQSSSTQVISRRGGHSIVMDDGDIIGNDQLVRIRTALGHQILLSDNGQTLSILHSNGQSYIELGKEGTIDMFSTNSVNIRTQGDLNLHADNNININAAKEFNVFAESINVESTKDFNQKVGTNSAIYTMGKHTHKVDGAMSMASGADASYASSTTTFINGSKINLNTGETATTPETVKSLKQILQTDTLYDSQKGFLAAPGKLSTIASRAPAHYPWSNAGQGVDVKTNLDAASQLPAAPAPAVANAAQNAGAVDPATAVTSAGVATVPAIGAVSSAIDKTATSALVSAASQTAASGPAAAAVAAGSGIIQNAEGKLTAVVGATALTPQQIEAAGYIKPMASATINGLVEQGANLTQAMSSNMFTGKDGVKDLSGLVNNVQAQATATVGILQNAQTALTNAGAMTGKEAAGGVGGMVLAGATQGVGATLDTVKNVGSSAIASVTGAAGAASDAVNKAMSAGNFASGFAQTGMGALSGISGAIGKSLSGVLDAAKGVAASAFNSIKGAIKPFEAGKPQDLGAIAGAQKAAQSIADAGKTALGGALGGITSAAGGLTSGVSALSNLSPASLSAGVAGAAGAITGAVGAAQNAVVGSITGAVGGLTSGVSAVSAAASGVTNLAGGQNAVASITNLASGATNNIPGTDAAKALINNASTAVNNGISTATAALSALPSGSALAAQAGGALQSLQNTAGNLAQDLAGKGQSLAGLAQSGLPAGAAAQLQSAIASISSIGDQQISLPSIGLNTTDRSGIAAQLTSVLGNPKIPSPNFSGAISTAAASALEANTAKINEGLKKVSELNVKYNEQQKVVDKAMAEFQNARNNLPAGDPKIEELRATVLAEVNKKIAITDEMQKILTA